MRWYKPTHSIYFSRRNKWGPLKYQEDKLKVLLVIFGDGMFGKDLVKRQGLRCGVAGIMWRCLKKREAAGDLLVVLIDEFLISKICKNRTQIGYPNVKGQSVLVCTTCDTPWQRDVKTAKNMMFISLSVWNINSIHLGKEM